MGEGERSGIVGLLSELVDGCRAGVEGDSAEGVEMLATLELEPGDVLGFGGERGTGETWDSDSSEEDCSEYSESVCSSGFSF